MTKQKTSEFGKGFVYNLILFSKHWWRHFEWLDNYKKMREDGENVGLFSDEDALSLWFNGASDHFYELEIPKQWQKKKIGKLAKWIQDKGLYWRHGFEKKPTQKDFDEMFEKIEELAMEIDKELGIEDIKADNR